MTKKIRAVAFDFDGVIADTTKLKSDLFVKMFEGLPEFEAIIDYEGKHQSLPRLKKLQFILSNILKKNVEENIHFYLQLYAKELETFLPKAPFIEGFEDFLKVLTQRQMKLYIVSSGMKEEIETYLGSSRRKYFIEVYDAGVAKPAALQAILKQLGLAVEELLFLGDNLSDYQASQEARCKFVAINPNATFPSGVKVFKDFTSFDETLLQ
jgi:phosphoglycolate phosphatase